MSKSPQDHRLRDPAANTINSPPRSIARSQYMSFRVPTCRGRGQEAEGRVVSKPAVFNSEANPPLPLYQVRIARDAERDIAAVHAAPSRSTLRSAADHLTPRHPGSRGCVAPGPGRHPGAPISPASSSGVPRRSRSSGGRHHWRGGARPARWPVRGSGHWLPRGRQGR